MLHKWRDFNSNSIKTRIETLKRLVILQLQHYILTAIPLKQGLKLCRENRYFHKMSNFNSNSIKTRIETYYILRRAFCPDNILTAIPLKQGLKHHRFILCQK